MRPGHLPPPAIAGTSFRRYEQLLVGGSPGGAAAAAAGRAATSGAAGGARVPRAGSADARGASKAGASGSPESSVPREPTGGGPAEAVSAGGLPLAGGWIHLPRELWVSILLLVGRPSEVLRAGLVCSELRRQSRDSVLWSLLVKRHFRGDDAAVAEAVRLQGRPCDWYRFYRNRVIKWRAAGAPHAPAPAHAAARFELDVSVRFAPCRRDGAPTYEISREAYESNSQAGVLFERQQQEQRQRRQDAAPPRPRAVNAPSSAVAAKSRTTVAAALPPRPPNASSAQLRAWRLEVKRLEALERQRELARQHAAWQRARASRLAACRPNASSGAGVGRPKTGGTAKLALVDSRSSQIVVEGLPWDPFRVFWARNRVFGPTQTQLDVYAGVGSYSVLNLLRGVSGAVLLYGQTGSGKTHTVFGPPSFFSCGSADPDWAWVSEVDRVLDALRLRSGSSSGAHAHAYAGPPNPSDGRSRASRNDNAGVYSAGWCSSRPLVAPASVGLAPRVFMDLMSELAADFETEFVLEVTYVEVYQDSLFDLLAFGPPQELRVARDDTRPASFVAAGARKVRVETLADACGLLRQGQARKRVHATAMNERSSRGHSDLAIRLVQRSRIVPGRALDATLHLVDLAGSERLGRSLSSGRAAEEARSINWSLAALERCVHGLTDGRSIGHVPYRDSKLTTLLAGALTGSTRAHLLVTCSSDQSDLAETVGSLRFAERAGRVNLPLQRAIVEARNSLLQLRQEFYPRVLAQFEDEPRWREAVRHLKACEEAMDAYHSVRNGLRNFVLLRDA